MKSKLFFISKITVMALVTFYGCKKYEDGPAFSLASKKSRVANTWKFEKVFEVESGYDYTSSHSDESLEFKKDGSFLWYSGGYAVNGTWEFSSDKENIIMTENGSSTGDSYKIMRLKNKELWFQQQFTGSTKEYHLVKK